MVVNISIVFMLSAGAHDLQFTANASMQNLGHVPQGHEHMDLGCAADVAEKYTLRQGLSPTFGHISFHRAAPAMSASHETYDDSVQVVENLIDAGLIDNAVAELKARPCITTDNITTRLDWTPACEDLRQFYVTNIHPQVHAKKKNRIAMLILHLGHYSAQDR